MKTMQDKHSCNGRLILRDYWVPNSTNTNDLE